MRLPLVRRFRSRGGSLLTTTAAVLLASCASISPPSESARSAETSRELSTTSARLQVELSFGDSPTLTIGGQALGSAIRMADGGTYRFPDDFQPLSPGWSEVTSVIHPLVGPAERLSARFQSTDGALEIGLEVAASEQTEALVYQLSGAPDARFAGFDLLDGSFAGLALPGTIDYLTNLSPGHVGGSIATGDPVVQLPLPPGAPLVLWSEVAEHGYVLAMLDQAQGVGRVSLSKPDPAQLRVGLATGPNPGLPGGSPRLYVGRIESRDLSASLAPFRAALDAVAPAAPLPDRFRHQWGSWYVYGGGITEEIIRKQIDTISDYYGDLGPWQVVLDAGWYLGGDNPDGEIGRVDEEKFPSGMRALVNYAHGRGVDLILYGPAPWIDSRPSTASWWVVQLGFLRDHPDWLILVDEDEEGATYVYDLSNPELREHLAGLVRRYLIDFDADGIELDMVGVIGPDGGPFRGDPVDLETIQRQQGVGQTMEVYRWLWETATRFKPQVWIESGYAAPPFARQYAHSWRVADDAAKFSNPYPFIGLLEQITFSALRHQLIGARPNLGFVHGDGETLPIQRQWLGAAVALQAQVNLSVDLAHTAPEIALMYREYLTALRPFSVTPFYGEGIPPSTFSSTVGGTTYLGLLNEAENTADFAVDLTAHGLLGTIPTLVFDPETRKYFVTGSTTTLPVPARSFRLVSARQTPGVLWADRASTERSGGERLEIDVDPGPTGLGHLWIYVPGMTSVDIDGAPGSSWTFDSAAGLLGVRLAGGEGYRITVRH